MNWITGMSLSVTALTSSAPDPRVGEDELDQHDPAREVQERQADRLDRRRQRVGQRVAQQHGSPREAL